MTKHDNVFRTFVFQAAGNIYFLLFDITLLREFCDSDCITWDGIRRRPREVYCIILALLVVMSTDCEALRHCSSDTAHSEPVGSVRRCDCVCVCVYSARDLRRLWWKKGWSLWVVTANSLNYLRHVSQLCICTLIKIWGSHWLPGELRTDSLEFGHYRKQGHIWRAVAASVTPCPNLTIFKLSVM